MPDPARLEIIIKEDGSVDRREPEPRQSSGQSQQPEQRSRRPQQPRTRTEPPPTSIPTTPPPPSALSGFGNIAQRGAGLFGPDVLNVAIARFSAVAGLFGDAQKQFNENLQRQRDVVKQQVDNVRNQMDSLRERRRQDPRLSGNVPPPPTRLPVAVSTPRIRQQRVRFEQKTEELMRSLVTRMDRLTARIDSMFLAAQQRAQQVRPFTQVPPSPRIIDVQPRRLSGPEGRERQPGLIPRVNALVPAAPRRSPQLPGVPPAPRSRIQLPSVPPPALRAGLPAIPPVPVKPPVIPAAPPQLAAMGIVAGVAAGSLAAMGFAAIKVKNIFNEMAAELEEISPVIQIARANQEITRLFGSLRRENQVGGDLARFIRLETETGELIRDLKVEIIKIAAEFLPVFEEIVGLIKDIAPLLTLIKPLIEIQVQFLKALVAAQILPAKVLAEILKLMQGEVDDEKVPTVDELDKVLFDFLGQDVPGIGAQPFNAGQPLADQPKVPHQGFVPPAGKLFNGP